MILSSVSTLIEPPAKVITLESVRRRFSPNHCQHQNVIVDEDLGDVECAQCGAKLNPVMVLARFAREESRYLREGERLRDLHAELEKRCRCKCTHCGKMTPIRGL